MAGPNMHSTMSYTDWLRRQVTKLEEEIGHHSVFETTAPATSTDLQELHSKVVIHTYLKQQLLRRETLSPFAGTVEDYDTQEYVIESTSLRVDKSTRPARPEKTAGCSMR
jgi:hypothetical protein